MALKLGVTLWDILNAGREVQRFTLGKTLSDYEADRLLQLAMERCFITIGEAIVRIRDHFPDEYKKMGEAQSIIAFRNHLTHRYDNVLDEEVWKVIQTFLPLLLAEVSQMLEGSA